MIRIILQSLPGLAYISKFQVYSRRTFCMERVFPLRRVLLFFVFVLAWEHSHKTFRCVESGFACHRAPMTFGVWLHLVYLLSIESCVFGILSRLSTPASDRIDPEF